MQTAVLAKGDDQLRHLAVEGVPLRGGRVVMREARLDHDALVNLI